MWTIQIQRHGGPDVLEVVDVDPPEPQPGQLLIDVAAVGVNYRDVYEREGAYGGRLGCSVFSPLAQGLQTDRYLDGVPEGSRAAGDGSFSNELATAGGQTLAQMAFA